MAEETGEAEEGLVKLVLHCSTDIMWPLIDYNFGGYAAYAFSLMPLYFNFRDLTSNGHRLISKTMFKENNPEIISSDWSLLPYKGFLNSSTQYLRLKWGTTQANVNVMRGASYSEEELREMKRKGVSDEIINSKILENAQAYSFWCMLQLSQNRRIGTIGLDANGKENMDSFYEMDMGRFFPRYDEQKAYSIDFEDFLRNAPETGIGERLTDSLDDFWHYYMEDKGSMMIRAVGQIREYSARLDWDSSDFLGRYGFTEPVAVSVEEDDEDGTVEIVWDETGEKIT